MPAIVMVGLHFDFRRSLSEAFSKREEILIPLLLPASLKAASVLMMPKTSWEYMGVILPWDGSGR